jgi:hypothetical protein
MVPPANDESPCPESARRTLENDRGPLHGLPCHEEPSAEPAPGPATPTCCGGDTSGNTAMWFINGTTVSSATGVGMVSTAWSVNSTTGQHRKACMDRILWRDRDGPAHHRPSARAAELLGGARLWRKRHHLRPDRCQTSSQAHLPDDLMSTPTSMIFQRRLEPVSPTCSSARCFEVDFLLRRNGGQLLCPRIFLP